MREEDFSKDRKASGNGLLITIGVTILILALLAWFALSRNSTDETIPDTASRIGSEIVSDYKEFVSSVDDTVSEIFESNDSAQPTNEDVSSVPYEKPEDNKTLAFSMPVEGEVLKDFDDKNLQYSKTFGDMRLHSGIDIAAKKGTSVSACADGTVINLESNGLYGNIITIDHGYGITVKYCSIEDLKVKTGEKVKAGDIIGTLGTVPAECNDPDHLHIEVFKNGVAVSPLKAMGF